MKHSIRGSGQSNIAIHAENLSKLYNIGRKQPYNTLRDLISETVAAPFRRREHNASDARLGHHLRRSRDQEQQWALQDVSFQVQHGEVVGFIGQNGAGKSTLLKILSRITEPTRGRAEIYGRLSSLLEVGVGFNPELTGRENVYLNGAILGMSKKEIRQRFDEIVEFAEVERFIDTPVKRYSSGMHMRLAFAVAAHLEPDILAVDEVLAVGDASFQRKCLGKMGSVAKAGRTILFVSHNMLAMEDLCDRVIWLKDGCIVSEGQPKAVISRYVQESFSTRTERVWTDRATAPGTEEVRLHRASVRATNGPQENPITVRTPFVMELEYWSLRPDIHLSPAIALYNEQGIIVFVSEPPFERRDHRDRSDPAGLYRYICRVPGDLLNNGTYQVALYIDKNGRTIWQEEEMLVFDVRDAIEMRHGRHGEWVGVVRPVLMWDMELVESGSSPTL